jgi:hypothetical protein
MAQSSNGVRAPATARHLKTPAALALGDLAAIFEDLQAVLACCERLLDGLTQGNGDNELVVDALWTTTLISYTRCFKPGKRGMGLAEKDLAETGLKGDVAEWHALLGRLRTYYVDNDTNPREAFFVGAAQAEDGKAEGIVLSSASQPLVDETTVRQTGRLAFELSRIVDGRIKAQQEKVFTTAKAMSADALSDLPSLAVGDQAPEG